MALFLCALGGVVLWVSQPPRRAHALQFAAFGALFYALSSPQISTSLALGCGALFSLCYALPLLIQLRMHPLIAAILLASQTLLWTLLSLGATVLLRGEPIRGAFATACLGAALCWLEWTWLPLWGTAQSFARGWSNAPRAVQFVALTGAAGAVWAILAVAALSALSLRHPDQFGSLGGALLLLVATLAVINFWLWNHHINAPRLRVAAFGWAGQAFDGMSGLSGEVLGAVSRAAGQGAKLFVSPEAAFQVENREAWRQSLQVEAARHNIALAIGYFDNPRNENCIDFVDCNGEITARYVKTHLVPVFENYTRGKGEMACCEVEGASVGGLICQDDNFSDLAGNYGRAATQILAIPTHDWHAVKDFHFANARWRALEFRLGLVKASSDGISAIVSPRGETLALCDHFGDGAQLIVADVPVFPRRPTLFARGRDWFPILCGLFVFWALLEARF